MPGIELIDLSRNRLNCEVPILFMPNLQILLLDYNNITNLRCLEEKQLIPSIENISMEGNPLFRRETQEEPRMRVEEQEQDGNRSMFGQSHKTYEDGGD